MSKQWFVATTKHQLEIRASAELKAQNYRVYLPKRHRQGIVGRKVEVITGLRFRGYIFIEFDLLAKEHGPISNTRSVGELLCRKEMDGPDEKMVPMALPKDWHTDMERHIDDEFEEVSGQSKPDPRADLHHGDIVQIDRKGHAAHGQQGEYSRTENDYAIVYVGWTKVKVPEIDLRLIEARRIRAA